MATLAAMNEQSIDNDSMACIVCPDGEDVHSVLNYGKLYLL